MQNILTIFRRDFKAYFTGPIGYIFMIVFLLISVGLYMTTFFAFPMADMRSFFGSLPILLCIFMPAVTMRAWAEERKENTWEMLLTFPMRASELVLGKYLTVLAFYALTLAATFTVPLMLASLGNPDNGAIIGGYLGTLLLGALFLAIGTFISGFCKDQIVAFVLTLLGCFMLYLVGTDFVAGQIDGFFPGLGALLAATLGVVEHYNAFTRGVIELVDVLYFLAWTILFLVLNIMYIEERGRVGAKVQFGVAVALCAGIGLAFNWLIADFSLGRMDMTENKIYTVSDATENILKDLDRKVKVTYYVTPKEEMPAQLKNLERDVRDKLDEMRAASGGNLEYNVLNMRAANVIAEPQMGPDEEEKEGEEKLEERMLEKGVQPFAVAAFESDATTQKYIYSSLLVQYAAKPEEVIPQILPQNMDNFEYRLVSAVFKITRDDEPVVALVAPQDALTPEMRRIYAQLGQPAPPAQDPYSNIVQLLNFEKYDIRRVDLTHENPLPDKYDALVIIEPQGLSERQRWEINRAVVSGKPVILAVQMYEWNYNITRDGLTLNRNDLDPGINALLENYGLKVSENILLDANAVTLNIPSGNQLADLLGGGSPVTLPFQMMLTNDNMNTDTAITNRLSSVLYLWGTALELDEERLAEAGLDATELIHSSNRAWSVPAEAPAEVRNAALQQEPPTQGTQFPLMALVEGQFPDAYAEEPRPAWPAPDPMQPGMPAPPPPTEEGEPEPLEPAPGKLMVVGCAQVFQDSFLSQGQNADLLLNAVDVAALSEKLLDVRGNKPMSRAITRPDDNKRVFWKAVNYGLMPVVILIVGIVVMVSRRQARMAYTVEHSADRP